jgi:hypothetical protein
MAVYAPRPATLDDLDELVEMQKLCAFESEGLELTDEVALRRGVRVPLESPHIAEYFVVDAPPEPASDRRIASCLMVTKEWSDWRGGEWHYINSVYTRRPYRGTGAYKALFGYLCRRCTDGSRPLPVLGLRLYYDEANDAAHEAYCRLRMQDTGYRLMEWRAAHKAAE